MDFSTLVAVKMHFIPNNCGEINSSPIPPKIINEVEKSGLKIFSFYENVTSRVLEPHVKERVFGMFCLTQLIDGDGFWHDISADAKIRLQLGDWMLVTPDFRHRYGSFCKYFTEDSILFAGPVAKSLYRAGVLHSGVIRCGGERRLLPIIRKLRIATLAAQFEAHALLLKLLLDLHNTGSSPEAGNGGDHRRKIGQLLDTLQAERGNWTVEEMAEYCNLSENYFRLLFREQTGMSPKSYLDQLRLNRAIELVCSGRDRIGDVARRLGFEDRYYFCRRFKELTGMTPTEYRRKYGKNPE